MKGRKIMLKNSLKYTIVAAVALMGAVFVSDKVIAEPTASGFEFAVIDLQKVVPASKDLNALRDERMKQVQDLQKMAETANEKIKAIENEEERKKASEDAVKEINAKKAEYDKTYQTTLEASNKKLEEIIKAVATEKGLNVILLKTVVLQGGQDITDAVIEKIK